MADREEDTQRRIFVLFVRPQKCVVFTGIHEVAGGGNEGSRTEPAAKLLFKLSDQLTAPWYFPSAG